MRVCFFLFCYAWVFFCHFSRRRVVCFTCRKSFSHWLHSTTTICYQQITTKYCIIIIEISVVCVFKQSDCLEKTQNFFFFFFLCFFFFSSSYSFILQSLLLLSLLLSLFLNIFFILNIMLAYCLCSALTNSLNFKKPTKTAHSKISG